MTRTENLLLMYQASQLIDRLEEADEAEAIHIFWGHMGEEDKIIQIMMMGEGVTSPIPCLIGKTLVPHIKRGIADLKTALGRAISDGEWKTETDLPGGES